MPKSALIVAMLAAATLWAGGAVAEAPAGEASRLYATGEYMAAADAASNHDTSANLAFAARALLTLCVTTEDTGDVATLLDRAERLARAALNRDPESVDARLQLALVYGMRSQRASIAEAFARNYAPRGRRLIEQALARAPDDARAYALLGAWHLEVLRRGGHAGAFAYGARFADGVAAFEHAMRLAPDDPTIPLHYAVALTQLDAEAHSARVQTLLQTARTLAPRDALETFAIDAARTLSTALSEGGPASAARAARDIRL